MRVFRSGAFPNRRSKFQGKLALILQDLFPPDSPGRPVFSVKGHQCHTKPAREPQRLVYIFLSGGL